jgi:hypothetical protein
MNRFRALWCGMAIGCGGAAHAVVAVSAEPTGGRVNVALCQTVVLDGDREGNFVRIEAALRDAKDRQPDVIVVEVSP